MNQAGSFGSPFLFQETDMRVTMIDMYEPPKKEGHTESADYRMDWNKNKVEGLSQRKDMKPAADNFETGLNCRKPL